MLPFDCALSYMSAVLPALRTQTATRSAGIADVGVHVQLLLVDQSVIAYHCAPSYTHHLNCCGPVPPEIDAVKVTGVPAGDGAGRDEEMLLSVSVPAVDGDDGGGGVDVPPLDVMGNAMLPFDPALSYASAVLPALRTQTATR